MQWPDLSAILAPLPWAVVGAAATRLYMPERSTLDLDVAVLARDAQQVRRRLRQTGYAHQSELAIGGSSWLSAEGTPVDVVEVGDEWEEALVEAASNRDEQGLPILSLPNLVLMKLSAGRVQDVADVARMLGFANEGSLAQVRSLIAARASEMSEDLESLIALGKLEVEGSESQQ